MKKYKKLLSLAAVVALSACGGSSSSSSDDPILEPSEPTIYGPLSTGSVSEPAFAYFDLETMTEVILTAEEAETDTTWDVAFKRSGVYLNNISTTPVSAYFTGNNAEFFDAEGNAVADEFINATPESELEDFTLVTAADIPADESLFVADITNNIMDGFYAYDSSTHQVTADDTHYYIVNSDTTFTKMRATSITQDGFNMANITLSYANQTSADVEFATVESHLIIDAAATCAAYDGIYVDFELGQTVATGDDWDVSIPCNDENTAASFSMDIADDAQAMQDFDNYYTAIDPDAINYYDFQSNEYTVKAFDANPWYQYGVNGGHTLWSQYGVYLIKTATATYKLQITSYYNAENVSGNISFRAEML